MNLAERIGLAAELSKYLQANTEDWKAAKQQAHRKNAWFTEEFINIAVKNIGEQFLQIEKLEEWVKHYHLDDNIAPKNTGVVMAGNIPLAGFHDFLSIFISGHRQTIKLSSKDDVLLKHLINKMVEWHPALHAAIRVAEILKGCDAYIATGSNNSARYFDYYFGKYPSIIRRNRTSVAIVDGNETTEELSLLADDVHLYFGLGCRNVTKIYVPEGYDFVPLLNAFNKYHYFADHTKYKNNYDYHLALLIMNNIYYMTNESILLVENDNCFSPIGQLNYSFYDEKNLPQHLLQEEKNLQCIIGRQNTDFGQAQKPSLFNYADGVDIMQFLLSL